MTRNPVQNPKQPLFEIIHLFVQRHCGHAPMTRKPVQNPKQPLFGKIPNNGYFGFSALRPNAFRYNPLQPSELTQEPKREPGGLVIFADDDLAHVLLAPVSQVLVINVVVRVAGVDSLIGRVDKPGCILIRNAPVVQVADPPVPYSPKVVGDPAFSVGPVVRLLAASPPRRYPHGGACLRPVGDHSDQVSLVLETNLEKWINEAIEGAAGLSKLIGSATEKLEGLKRERAELLVAVGQAKNDTLSHAVDLISALSTLSGEELLTARTMLKTSLIPQIVQRVEIEVINGKTANYTIKLVGGRVIHGDSSGWRKSATVSYMETTTNSLLNCTCERGRDSRNRLTNIERPST